VRESLYLVGLFHPLTGVHKHMVMVSLGIELLSVGTTSGSNLTHKSPAVLIQNWIKVQQMGRHTVVFIQVLLTSYSVLK